MINHEQLVAEYNGRRDSMKRTGLLLPHITRMQDLVTGTRTYIDPPSSARSSDPGVYLSVESISGFVEVKGKTRWAAVYGDLTGEARTAFDRYAYEGVGMLKATDQISSDPAQRFMDYVIIFMSDNLSIANYPVALVDRQETIDWYTAIQAAAVAAGEAS